MSEHVLIFKQTAARPGGPDALLAWTCFRRYDSAHRFRGFGSDQLHELAVVEAGRAIEAGCNLTIGWGPFDPTTTAPDLLEDMFLSLRPLTIFCPEQARRPDAWIISNMCGTPGGLPVTAVQAQLTRTVETLCPRWLPRGGIRPDDWAAEAILVRFDVTALDLGIVELAQLTPDDRMALVANNPQVREAVRASDPAKAETMHALIRARVEAQAKAGVAPADVAPVCLGEIEALLMPVVFSIGRGDAPGALALLHEDLRRRYGPSGETVLAFALRVFPHDSPGIDALRAAAKEAVVATAA